MSGSGTDRVRLARLRADAADEEWVQSNPTSAALRPKFKRLRIWCKVTFAEFSQSEHGKRYLSQLQTLEQRSWSLLIRCYLLITRWGGCRPARYRGVLDLSSKQLLEELAKRGVDTSAFVERDELLQALCGPACDAELAAGADHYSSDTQTVDKMV